MAKSSFLLLLRLVAFAVSAMAAREISTETTPSSMMEVRQRASRRPTENELAILQDRLGYKFKKMNLLIEALTHSSFSEANNDILHVLGGKSVQQAIALHLIMENPDVTKGELDSFIRKHSEAKECAKDAAEIGLDSLIMVGKGVGDINNKILSSAFNAVFGAITVDDGPTTANFAYWTVKKWNDHHVDVI
ncbi:hypothetical protein M758_5G018800 [Ceratodon purpureus]|nr:hypothetical protein M758_5G018800 [Ceratodon purpureus]